MTTEPELLRIPWEFLRRNGKDLAGQRDCTIVRELVTAEPARPLLVEGKIRMLGVIANPRRDLDVEGEKRRVTEALEKCKDQVELEWARGLHLQVAAAEAARSDFTSCISSGTVRSPPRAIRSSC